MKTDIHPKYYQTTITCTGCNNTFQAGSTTESIRVDICSNCHPFFTGQKKLIDTEGRVERFERRSAQGINKAKPKKAKAQPVFASSKAKDTVTPIEQQSNQNRPKSLREMLQEAANNS